jgi:hypothetical protein
MPGQHATTEECISAWIPRQLATKVRKAAKARRMTITDFLEEVYRNATEHIPIDDEDREEIQKAERRAARRILAKRAKGKAAKKG